MDRPKPTVRRYLYLRWLLVSIPEYWSIRVHCTRTFHPMTFAAKSPLLDYSSGERRTSTRRTIGQWSPLSSSMLKMIIATMLCANQYEPNPSYDYIVVPGTMYSE